MDKQNEIWDKQRIMTAKISDFLHDLGIREMIGNKTYDEFARYLCELIPVNMITDELKSNSKFMGHKMSVVRYYCDTFNNKEIDK